RSSVVVRVESLANQHSGRTIRNPAGRAKGQKAAVRIVQVMNRHRPALKNGSLRKTSNGSTPILLAFPCATLHYSMITKSQKQSYRGSHGRQHNWTSFSRHHLWRKPWSGAGLHR